MTRGNGLRDAYSATLARIKAQKGSKATLGMGVLMWLSHSERPLNVGELCHALGVEIGSTNLDYQNIPAIETVLGCSLGLVVLEASSYTLRLVHYTLQEYLSNNSDLFHSPHLMIAEACLTYLNFECIRDLSPVLRCPRREAPFLEYASCYWGVHARREIGSGGEITEGVNTLAVGLLDGFENHISSVILLSRSDDHWDWEIGWSNPTWFTGLHGASYLGMEETTRALLGIREWDLGATDVAGNTASSWAARKGNDNTLKMLLGQEGITPNAADKDGRTPLSWAAGNRCENVVKILLGREDVTPNIADKDGRTPLLWAARKGFGDVVKIIFERQDVNPNTADGEGRTPLSWAARNGFEHVVKILLEHCDVNPNTADEGGRTPLSWASGGGHAAAVSLLYGRENVDPNTADKSGRTPLSWVAGDGRGRIVEMLFEHRDVDPNAADKNGRTPLSWAARHSHRDIVETLCRTAGRRSRH